ncbi:MAG: ceramidase domain-containing protein [Pikeienuella sp.]
MDWTTQVDNYCERIDPSFWSEPLNAVTNLSFIIAALLCLNMTVRRDREEGYTFALCAILFCIGVGSFLFHTFATKWAGVADVVPILLFILLYVYAATRRYLNAGHLTAALAVIGALLFSSAFPGLWNSVLPSINGSEAYVSTLLIIIGYGAVLARRGHPAATGLFATAALLSLSLTFRSIDPVVCDVVPVGTHFMWHTLNGILLGVALATFIRHGAPASATRA